jgi:ribosomal-protein-alanine N-acetyltransferase
MSDSDLQQVYEIERQCFTAPWSIDSFRYELNNRLTILLIASLKGNIVGYVCLRTIVDVTHLLNLAVHPKFRGKGIGTRLLHKAIDELKASEHGSRFLTLEVRESNLPAINLYKKFGFEVIGRRKAYYQSPREDAILMGREL